MSIAEKFFFSILIYLNSMLILCQFMSISQTDRRKDKHIKIIVRNLTIYIIFSENFGQKFFSEYIRKDDFFKKKAEKIISTDFI